MSEAIVINGYVLPEPLTGENAGFSRWGYGKKNGREYFIKEFLDPVYPTEDSPYSESMKQQIRAACRSYQEQKQRLYNAVNRASDGNLLRVEEFFRWGSRYYITTRRVPALKMTFKELAQRPLPERLQVCCNLSHALMRLHEAGVIHADIKPSNILLERTAQGCVAGRLIDVDCSFFEDDPPEELGGDQVYFSPEGMRYNIEGPGEVALTTKLDVYAMGLVMHELITGELPKVDEEYSYVFESSLDDKPPLVDPSLPQSLRVVLMKMLTRDPDKRSDMRQVFFGLRSILPGDAPASAPPKPPAAKAKPEASGKGEVSGRLKIKF